MAVLRIQENIKKADGTYDVVHKETEAGLVLFDQTEVKQAPAGEDYIPIIDSADNERVKKIPANALVTPTDLAQIYPMIGTAADVDKLKPGGILFITEGELPEGVVTPTALDESWKEAY